jgi:hypothetical protein
MMPALCPAGFPFINGKLPDSSEKPPLHLRNRSAIFLLFVQVSLDLDLAKRRKQQPADQEARRGTKGEISDVF